jgi:hypothetical protein
MAYPFLKIRINGITSANPVTFQVKTGGTPVPMTGNTWTNIDKGPDPLGNDYILTGMNFEFNTLYWIKMIDSVTGRFIIQDIYTNDSNTFTCYDTINFGVVYDVQCITPSPTPTPTQTPTPTIPNAPTNPPTATATSTPTATPTPTPTPTNNPQYFIADASFGSSALDACSGPNNSGISVRITGDTTDFCTSSTFTGNTFAYHTSGTYYLEYNNKYRIITLTGSSNIVTVQGGGCTNCPVPAQLYGIIRTTAPVSPADCGVGGIQNQYGQQLVWKFESNNDTFTTSSIFSDYFIYDPTYNKLADFNLVNGTTYYLCGPGGFYTSFVYHGGSTITAGTTLACPVAYELAVYGAGNATSACAFHTAAVAAVNNGSSSNITEYYINHGGLYIITTLQSDNTLIDSYIYYDAYRQNYPVFAGDGVTIYVDVDGNYGTIDSTGLYSEIHCCGGNCHSQ